MCLAQKMRITLNLKKCTLNTINTTTKLSHTQWCSEDARRRLLIYYKDTFNKHRELQQENTHG